MNAHENEAAKGSASLGGCLFSDVFQLVVWATLNTARVDGMSPDCLADSGRHYKLPETSPSCHNSQCKISLS